MKLVYKGRFQSFDDLPVADLPARAVVYDEPDSLEEIAFAAQRWLIPIVLMILFGLFLRWAVHGVFFIFPTLLGLFLVFPLMFVHEGIHALFFPRGSTVYLYEHLKKGILFVTSTDPLSKSRFIVLSLAPFVLLGLLPLLYACLAPPDAFLVRTAFTAGSIMMLVCTGDFLNVANTIRQVPNGATVQLSGIHTYWYETDKEAY